MDNTKALETRTLNCNEVLGNGKKYRVPLYQRDYSWNEEQWEDLWADIILAIEQNAAHYFGAIVLQSSENKVFTVIDGQQRLTSITLIALACIARIRYLAECDIDKIANEERVKLLGTKFIGDKDPSSLSYFSKLSLNENNNSFFQSYILTDRTPSTLRNLKDSDRLLMRALAFFKNKVNAFFAENTKGEDVARFLNEDVADRLIFIQIVVDTEIRAYTVFETLNSRGIGLTVTDLLKNYLFSLVAEVDLPIVRSQWNRIVDAVGLDDFPQFLRCYWISKYALVRQANLFKQMRSKIQNSEQLFLLLEDLERNAELYIALSHSSDELWRGKKEIKKRIKELELFQIKQVFPLLLVAYEKMQPSFEKILRIVSVISFRSVVIGGYAESKWEDIFHKTALKMANGELSTARQVANALMDIYISDSDFKNDFSTKSLNTRRFKRLVRYILFEVENYSSQNSYDFEDHSATIEHILPENPSEEWENCFSKNYMDSFVYRLGNYALLEEGKNREIGNTSFSQKAKVFESSSFVSTKQIAYSEWNANTLEKRQMEMAKIACQIWRLDY